MLNFYIGVMGVDVTGNFLDSATSITVTDSSGDTADSAQIDVADDDGSISLPAIGDPVAIGMGEPPVVVFEGFIDDVSSSGSRGSGRTLSISAKSADTVKGKLKEQSEKHKDDAELGAVAKEWGKDAGIDEMFVHADLASIKREYWSMNNESFPAWGKRIASSLGATFKIFGTKAVMIPRSAGVSADGGALTPVRAEWGVNLISWSGMKPSLGRPQHAEFRTRHFDIAKGDWLDSREAASYDTTAEAVLTSRFSEVDEAAGLDRAKSSEKESDRERGGGSIVIDGDPTAQAEAMCILVGARPGIDGEYRIDSVTQTRSRGGGFTSSLSLKQPKGDAGKDTRPSEGGSDGKSTAPKGDWLADYK